MKLITERERIRNAAAKWKRRQTKPEFAALLDSIDLDTATAEQIVKVIGNDGWMTKACDECQRPMLDLVHLGEEPDYESTTFFICTDCLSRAFALIGNPAAFRFR